MNNLYNVVQLIVAIINVLVLLWIAFARKLTSFYHYAEKNDPSIAENLKHIATFAEWSVSDETRHTDKAGTDKLADAVQKTITQAQNAGIKDIDNFDVKGAVQTAYLKTVQPTVNNETVTGEITEVVKPADINIDSKEAAKVLAEQMKAKAIVANSVDMNEGLQEADDNTISTDDLRQGRQQSY